MRRFWSSPVFSSSVFVVALAAAGCKEPNPDYCPQADAYNKSCSRANAAADAAARDAKDAREAGGDAGDAAAHDAGDARDAGDATADAADAPVEKKPLCTVDGGECAAMADGGGLLTCDTSGVQPRCVECVESKNCQDSKKPVCDTKVNRCVECIGTGTECAFDAARTACDVAAQKCVECVDDTRCAGTKPVCDTAKKACRACAADAECKAGPGLCVDWDGHCAQASEVVTLQGGAGCVQAAPNYCKAADAANALSPSRPILLVKGPDAVAAIDPPAGAATQVLIAGKAGALVGAGSGDPGGVHLTGATEFWVRDLKVSGGTIGIVIDGAKMAHINRCVVAGNGKGGILTSNASFDITNTVIADNLAGLDTSVGAGFGGVRLNDPPAGGTARFENNTVVNNKLIGVSCKTPRDVSSSVVYGNVGGEALNCAGSACCGAGDPKVDPTTYLLMSGSPCIDKLPATAMSVTTDVQGQARPTPPAGKLDCGADEFGP
jgi:hypothetical protein